MAKYVMSNRRAGKFGTKAQLASRNTMDSAFSRFSNNVQVLSDFNTGETSRRTIVFDADPGEIFTIARDLEGGNTTPE